MDDEVDADLVAAAFGDDDVGKALGRLDELHVHGTDGGHVLLDDGFHGAAALIDVALEAAHEADVGVGVHEDFDVHQFAEGRVFENEDALENDGGARLDAGDLRDAAMRGEIVRGQIDGFAGAQPAKMLDEERRFDRVGMIEIEPGAILEREFGMVFVIGIVAEHHGRIGRKRLDDFARERGFAGAGAAADADD